MHENEPINKVTHDCFREKMKHKNKFGKKTVCSVIIAMTEIVEDKLVAEMNASGWDILFMMDGQSLLNTILVCLPLTWQHNLRLTRSA